VIVDAHLDLAWHALTTGRDLTRPLPPGARAMTSLPDLGRAGIGLVCATLFAEPADAWNGDGPTTGGARYATPQEAESQALAQLAVYRGWEAGGHARVITGRASLEAHLSRFAEDRIPGLVILMEGADPIVAVDDLDAWWDRGVRIVGLSWGTTRYAGGTGSTAGVSADGETLLRAMAARGVIWDVSHLSDEAFDAAIKLEHHAVCATHGAARAFRDRPGRLPAGRFWTDAQIRAVAAAGGVLGLVMLSEFLDAAWSAGGERAVELDGRVAAQFAHVAALAGWDRVGLGSDVDAGKDRDGAPDGLDSVLDWPRIGEAVPPGARTGVLGENWLRFLRAALPEE